MGNCIPTTLVSCTCLYMGGSLVNIVVSFDENETRLPRKRRTRQPRLLDMRGEKNLVDNAIKTGNRLVLLNCAVVFTVRENLVTRNPSRRRNVAPPPPPQRKHEITAPGIKGKTEDQKISRKRNFKKVEISCIRRRRRRRGKLISRIFVLPPPSLPPETAVYLIRRYFFSLGARGRSSRT